MLAGWTLLGHTCPTTTCSGTPLMSLQGGPMKCVACDKDYELDANQDIKLIAPQVQASSTSVSSSLNDHADIKEDDFYFVDAPVLPSYRNNSTDDASSMIAKYLIEGI